MDNYYTSPRLFLTLYNKGVNACGTARVNRRGFPKELICKGGIKKRGYYDYRSNGPLLAVFWRDKRYIYFISTIHGAGLCDGSPVTVLRRQQDGSQIPIVCPPLLPDYQACMRGVDRGDQMIGCYNVGRRSKNGGRGFFLTRSRVHH